MSVPGVALTVDEVARYARMAQGQLFRIPWPQRGEHVGRAQVEQALAALNELLLLVDLVYAADAGTVVIVDPEDVRA